MSDQDYEHSIEYAGNLPLKQLERDELTVLGNNPTQVNKQDIDRNDGINDRQMKSVVGQNQQQPQYDENEFSGILSSPGLCGNNSLLQRQDDVMNNFLQNLKQKVEQNEEANNASQDQFLNDLISSQSRLQTQSHLGFSQIKSNFNDRKKSMDTKAQISGQQMQNEFKGVQKSPSGASNSSPVANILKQSQFSDQNEDNNQMSQLGQFAQLSYLLNNLNQKQNVALENFKNDKSLLDYINQNSNGQVSDGQGTNTQSQLLANPNSQYLLSQLSQFGLLKTQGGVQSQDTNHSENQASRKIEQLVQKQQSNTGNLELDELQVPKKQTIENTNLKGSSILKASTFEGKGSSVTSLPTTNRNIMGGDLSFKNEELRQEEQNRQKRIGNQRRQDSMTDCQKAPASGINRKSSETFNDLKEISGDGSMRSNRWLAEKSKSKPTNMSKEKPDLMKKNDDENLRQSQGDKNSDQECEQYFESMQKLMSEKERLNQEQEKIRSNKFLQMVDRNNAIKSVRSLSRTIEDLIAKEKDKISDHYQSKLSKSRASNLTQSRALNESHMEQNLKNQIVQSIQNSDQRNFASAGINPLPNDEIGESQLKFSTLTKTTNQNQANIGTGYQKTITRGISPGGTTDSLQFSQSVALSNLATTMRGKGALNSAQQNTLKVSDNLNRQNKLLSNSRERAQVYKYGEIEIDQNRALEFGDLNGDGQNISQKPKVSAIQQQIEEEKLVTLQHRSEFLFSDISDMHDKIKLKDANESQDINDLHLPYNVHGDHQEQFDSRQEDRQEDKSFPPTITHENFQADMLASLRKRASIDMQNDHLANNDSLKGSQNFVESELSGFGIDNPNQYYDPQKQTIEQSIQSTHHLDCAKQYTEGNKNKYQREHINTQTRQQNNQNNEVQNLQSDNQLELLILRREKDQLAILNKQLESKLALKEQQLQNHQKQIQLRQKTNDAFVLDHKNMLIELEYQLESKHQAEISRIREEHKQELQGLSMQSRNNIEFQEIKEQNDQLMKENEYLREAQERYQILQRSFNQIEQCSISSEVEERLRPMIDREVLRYRDQNEQLIAQNEEILNEMQRLEDRIKQAETSHHESEQTIQRQREEIKVKEKLLNEAKNQSIQSLEKEKDIQARLLQKIDTKDQSTVLELSQCKNQISKKDLQIKQLQDSITQLENGLNQITDEAKNVIQKNQKLRKENEALKLDLKSKLEDKRLLAESQQQKSSLKQNQQIIKQLKETIKAQKDLIKQMEQQNQQFEQSLVNERAENEKLVAKIQEQNTEINAYEKSRETADKAARNLSNIDRDELIKQIDILKAIEQRQKKKLTAMQSEINDRLKDVSETNQKYTKQLELNSELRKQLDDNVESATSANLENSQLKLQIQQKQSELKEYRQKLENKFVQQDKVIQHKQRQIDDLKDSIALKITVADDLQKLLHEQKKQLQETRNAQLVEFERAKEELEESKKKTLQERDEILQKLWTSQSAVEQLKTINKQILGDMDQLKKSIKKSSQGKTQHQNQKSELTRSITPKKQRNQSRSKSKTRPASRDFQQEQKNDQQQPLINQLDNLRSTYLSKMASIQTDILERADTELTTQDFRRDNQRQALNLAQLTQDGTPSPVKERPGHMTFAKERSSARSIYPNDQNIKVEEAVIISSENEYRIMKDEKKSKSQNEQLTDRSKGYEVEPFDEDRNLMPDIGKNTLIERQMMKLKQSQEKNRNQFQEQYQIQDYKKSNDLDKSFESNDNVEGNENCLHPDLAASIDSFITKEQQQLTTSRLQREIQDSSLRYNQPEEMNEHQLIEDQEAMDMQESRIKREQ